MYTVPPRRSLSRKESNVRPIRPEKPPAVPAMVQDRPDMIYIAALVALVSVGLIMVFSTTAVKGGFSELTKTMIFAAIGGTLMLITSLVPAKWWRAAAPWILVAVVLALASLLLKDKNPIAIGAKGAYRWLRVPGIGQVQPSEIAKFAFVLFAAQFLEKKGRHMGGREWGAFLLVLGGLGGLIYKEPDLGTALVLVGIAFAMLVVAGVRWSLLIKGVLVLAVLVGTLAWNTPHQQDRLVAWWNPFEEKHRQADGFQVVQSLSAMSRGGLLGVGMGQSIHKLNNRLPEARTDFIFAIIAEEMGMLRAFGVLALFGILTWRGFGIAARAPDRYLALIAVGITAWIGVQACLNVAVVTGTVPNTGVPLPFISAGGSSLVALMMATGVVVGISRWRPLKEEARVR